MLHAKYGLTWPDWTFEEVMEAIQLNDADQDHMVNALKRQAKGK